MIDDPMLIEGPPISTALARRAPVDVASVAEMRAIMSEKDDEQILAAMAGAMLDEWTYEFRMGGEVVQGISAPGALEIARLRAEDGFPIRFPVDQLWAEEVTQNGEPGLRIRIVARDVRTGAEGVGMVFEPYFQTVGVRDKAGRKTGETKRIANDFADRKALGKARRNAILDLVPKAQIKYLLTNRKAIVAKNAAQAPRVTQAARREAARVESGMSGKPVPVITSGEYVGEAAPAAAAVAAAPRTSGAMATEAQIAKLLQLAEHPALSAHRDAILDRLQRPVKATVAETWITAYEAQTVGPLAPSTGDEDAAAGDDGELALGETRRGPRNAIAEGL